jgi:hypothetical protein
MVFGELTHAGDAAMHAGFVLMYICVSCCHVIGAWGGFTEVKDAGMAE